MLSYSGLDPYFMVPIISYVKNNYKVKKWIVETYSFKLVAPPKISDSRIITDAPPEVKIDLLKRQFNLLNEY